MKRLVALWIMLVTGLASAGFVPRQDFTSDTTKPSIKRTLTLNQASSQQVVWHFTNGTSALDLTGATTATFTFAPASRAWSSTITGSVLAASSGLVSYVWTPAQLNTNGNFRWQIEVKDSTNTLAYAYGDLTLLENVTATAAGALPTNGVLNWALFTNYQATAASGPYRAGTGISLCPTNGDGSVQITATVSTALSDHTNATGTSVHGLGTAATNANSAYATASQGAKADMAVTNVTFSTNAPNYSTYSSGSLVIGTNATATSTNGLASVIYVDAQITSATNTAIADATNKAGATAALLYEPTFPGTAVTNHQDIVRLGALRLTNNVLIVNLNTTEPTTNLATTAISARGADNAAVRIASSSYGVGGTGAYANRHARGTAASLAAVQAGDQLFSVEGWGYGDTGYSVSPRVMVKGFAGDTWTDTYTPSYLGFWTTDGGIIPYERMRVNTNGAVYIGTTTGSNDERLNVKGHVAIQSNLTIEGSVDFAGPVTMAGSPASGYARLTGQTVNGQVWLNIEQPDGSNYRVLRDTVFTGYNYSGGTLSNGTLVAFEQSTTGMTTTAHWLIPALATDATKMPVQGMVVGGNITNGGTGNFAWITRTPTGYLNAVLSALPYGTPLYASVTEAGGMQSAEPTTAGQRKQIVGYVNYNGAVDVRIKESSVIENSAVNKVWNFWPGSNNTVGAAANYKAMRLVGETADAAAQTWWTNASATITNGNYIGFVSKPMNVTQVKAGTYDIVADMVLTGSGGPTLSLAGEIYLRQTNGTEVEITPVSGTTAQALSTSSLQYIFRLSVATDTVCNATDSIMAKFKYSGKSGTVNLIIKSGSLTIPIPSGQFPTFQDLYTATNACLQKAGGTMSGNINLGGNTISNGYFRGDGSMLTNVTATNLSLAAITNQPPTDTSLLTATFSGGTTNYAWSTLAVRTPHALTWAASNVVDLTWDEGWLDLNGKAATTLYMPLVASNYAASYTLHVNISTNSFVIATNGLSIVTAVSTTTVPASISTMVEFWKPYGSNVWLYGVMR